jgi:hypothetical protein
MRTEGHGGRFETESRACAGLKEQQRDRAAEQLLAWCQTGLKVIRRLTEIIDIVDGKIACAQEMPNPAGPRLITRALIKSRRRN